MAPEVIMQEYGALCDEWSVGELLTTSLTAARKKRRVWGLLVIIIIEQQKQHSDQLAAQELGRG